MVEDKYNRKNPAVKRILQEVREMQSNPSDDFMILPLEDYHRTPSMWLSHICLAMWEKCMPPTSAPSPTTQGGKRRGRRKKKTFHAENIFEWQFAITCPQDTEFEGEIYHGRIQLPSEYPFKPPSFMLLTPSGRFDTQIKICLSISNHHPEHWKPSWSVRTALVALIAFMPTNPNGALGSLDYIKEERRALAVKSQEAPPKSVSPERQKLIYEIHEYMLSKVPPVP